MKKIAMMNCLKSNEVCTGAACLKAFYERRAGFARYDGQDLQLTAFLRCSSCGQKPEDGKGMTEKLERLLKEGTETVHIGVCAQMNQTRCETMQLYADWLESRGIEIVWQTH